MAAVGALALSWDLMGREEIQARLEMPQPIRQGEFCLMSGYSGPTLRRLLKERFIRGVCLPGVSEKRIPIDEASRILRDLHIIP